jgi:hypothetical protein
MTQLLDNDIYYRIIRPSILKKGDGNVAIGICSDAWSEPGRGQLDRTAIRSATGVETLNEIMWIPGSFKIVMPPLNHEVAVLCEGDGWIIEICVCLFENIYWIRHRN